MTEQAQQAEQYAATLDSVKEAAARIAPHIRHTPVHTSSAVNQLAGGKHELFFKCEIFQRCGSFKARGALNAVYSLSDEEAARGVVTHSSGNHAGALSMAARTRGIPAYIVVPKGAPDPKVKAIREYGGQISFCEPTMEAREAAAKQVQLETGARLVPPFNDGTVMSGQGTIALELLEQVPDLDYLIIPVSGGGMLAGNAICGKALKPSLKLIAAEPVGTNDAPDAYLSKKAGRVVECPKTLTIADGLQAQMGTLTWPVIRDLVDSVVTVTEAEIIQAMRILFERMKLVVEPSGAVGLAAALSSQFQEEAGASSK